MTNEQIAERVAKDFADFPSEWGRKLATAITTALDQREREVRGEERERAAGIAEVHDFTHSSGYRCHRGKVIAERIRDTRQDAKAGPSQSGDDPTRFTIRSFAMVWNVGRSIRLINRNDVRQAISIPWDELGALRALLGDASIRRADTQEGE